MMKPIDSADKSTMIHGVIGALIAAYAYMKGIDFQLAQIDPERAMTWMVGLAAYLGYSNRLNHKKSVPGEGPRVYDMSLPVGMRINNPGNIRPDDRWEWDGQARVYISETSGAFVEFETIDWGMRAAARNLINQQRLHNLRTIDGIITKYAPPSENDTEAYIASMMRKTGFTRHQELDLENPVTAVKMLKAIIGHEQGRNDYSSDLILRGIKAAL